MHLYQKETASDNITIMKEEKKLKHGQSVHKHLSQSTNLLKYHTLNTRK